MGETSDRAQDASATGLRRSWEVVDTHTVRFMRLVRDESQRLGSRTRLGTLSASRAPCHRLLTMP